MIDLINKPVKVGENEVGMRLDRYIQRNFPELNFISIQKLLRTGQIRLDGKRALGSSRLKIGNIIRVPKHLKYQNDNKFEVFKPLNVFWKKIIDNGILYKDKNIIALNKPAGLAVQGGSKIKNNLDDNLDYFRFDSLFRPQLLHRLDKDTSGVLVLSRNPNTTKRLGLDFKNRNIKKNYIAVLMGHLPKRKGQINYSLGKIKKNKFEITSHVLSGQDAKTFYKVLWKGTFQGVKVSIVDFAPETGRKHQIRAHCKYLGCHILGDKKYTIKNKTSKLVFKNNQYMQLHAKEIAIPDNERETLRIIAPIPEHMFLIFKELNLSSKLIS